MPTNQAAGAPLYRSAPKIRFQDVQKSLPQFSGQESDNIEVFLKEFKDWARSFEWSKLERLIYAKNQMTASAKKFVEQELKPKTFDALKKGPRAEFLTEKNTALIHKKLSLMRKNDKETFREFVYRIVAIAQQADIPEISCVTYAVNGISDNKRNKATLYECKTIKKLKAKLQTYAQVNCNIYDSTGKKLDTEK